jgi:hypothetical protein
LECQNYVTDKIPADDDRCEGSSCKQSHYFPSEVEEVDNKQESCSNIIGGAIDEIVLVTGGGLVDSSSSKSSLCSSIWDDYKQMIIGGFCCSSNGKTDMNSRSVSSHCSNFGCSKIYGNKLAGSGDIANSSSKGNDVNGSTIVISDSSCSRISCIKLGDNEVNNTTRSSFVSMAVSVGKKTGF